MQLYSFGIMSWWNIKSNGSWSYLHYITMYIKTNLETENNTRTLRVKMNHNNNTRYNLISRNEILILWKSRRWRNLRGRKLILPYLIFLNNWWSLPQDAPLLIYSKLYNILAEFILGTFSWKNQVTLINCDSFEYVVARKSVLMGRIENMSFLTQEFEWDYMDDLYSSVVTELAKCSGVSSIM